MNRERDVGGQRRETGTEIERETGQFELHLKQFILISVIKVKSLDKVTGITVVTSNKNSHRKRLLMIVCSIWFEFWS